MAIHNLAALLASGLGQGLNQGYDRAVVNRERDEAMQAQQQQAMAQQAQKQREAELFTNLLNNSDPNIDINAALQMGAQGGLNHNQLSSIEKSYSRRIAEENRNKLANEKFQFQKDQAEINRKLKEEAPQRKAVTQQVNKSIETLPFIEKEIGYYEALKKLPESGKLRQGNWRKVLDKVGLGDLWQSPESDLAEKLISNISVSQAQGATNFGQATNDKLELIQKANPTLLQSPKGFRAAIEMNIRSKKVDKAIADELQKISKESKGAYPLDAMSMALERAKPEIEKLHQEQLDIATTLAFPEASKYKGKGTEDPETGRVYESNGKQWIFRGYRQNRE